MDADAPATYTYVISGKNSELKGKIAVPAEFFRPLPRSELDAWEK